MGRVMVIGYGPLPQSGQMFTPAPALRTRQFLKSILAAGHTVNLYTLPLPGAEGADKDVAAMAPENYEGLTYQRFSHHSGEFAIRTLTDQARQLGPDAIVSVTTYASYIASKLTTTVPLWVDLNGYWMAERQGQAWQSGDDDRIAGGWAVERTILRRLDRFSAVTRPQLHAVLGELAGVGRLSRFTYEYQFGAHVPNAADAWLDFGQGGQGDPQPYLRGPRVSTDAFIILWSGGFKAWADVETLVEALDLLMAGYPQVHFVSTGGAVKGVDALTYQRFEDLVAHSPHKNRYHLLGWVDSSRLGQIYREADVGINVDGLNYETFFGARARINGMVMMDLAVVSTLGTEISEWLHDGGALLGAPIGDPKALAAAIEPWIEQREHLECCARNARRILEEDFSSARTMRSLMRWLDAPAPAPDNQAKLDQARGKLESHLAVALNPLEQQAMLLEQYSGAELAEALKQWARPRSSSLRRTLFGLKKNP